MIADIEKFRDYLVESEKSVATTEKYLRDAKAFVRWLAGRRPDKQLVLEYKRGLTECYAPASVNSMLSAVNCFLGFVGCADCRVRLLKIQRQIFASADRELTRSEYSRLLDAAKMRGDRRLYLLMQTICSTGIRVSELAFVTVAAIKKGELLISCKGKMRQVLLPKKLCRLLADYVDVQGIAAGAVFVSKGGSALNRSNIWRMMKGLCRQARVAECKVFPHNLRHLFARTFYGLEKDVVRLADVLGHSSINTTRIYTMESGATHRRQIQRLGLLDEGWYNNT